ncbi:MAG TPA: GNAT family N-acetyltransferase [Gemmatimonadota bacterium]|nr:GNAT family N-acetyltransferase [Gemmatimonadota bacterium]
MANAPTPDARVTLREVTRHNLREVLLLEVAPEQNRFVASNAISIAQAHFYPEVAWFRAIYADEVPVGFLMLEDSPGAAEVFLWRFMIDRRFQNHGFGRRAIELVLEHVRARAGTTALTLSHVPGEGSPGPFYQRLGFVHTGEQDPDGELLMRLEL